MARRSKNSNTENNSGGILWTACYLLDSFFFLRVDWLPVVVIKGFQQE